MGAGRTLHAYRDGDKKSERVSSGKQQVVGVGEYHRGAGRKEGGGLRRTRRDPGMRRPCLSLRHFIPDSLWGSIAEDPLRSSTVGLRCNQLTYRLGRRGVGDMYHMVFIAEARARPLLIARTGVRGTLPHGHTHTRDPDRLGQMVGVAVADGRHALYGRICTARAPHVAFPTCLPVRG